MDRTEQIFHLVRFPSFVSPLSGRPNESLCFVKAIEKRAASEINSDTNDYFISGVKKFLKGI